MRFVTPAVAALGLCAALSAQAPRQLYQIHNPTAGQLLLIRQQFDLLDGCCGSAPASGDVRFVTEATQMALVGNLLPSATHVRAVRPYQQTFQLAMAAAGIDVPPAAYYTAAEIEAAIDNEVATYPGLAAKVDISALPGGLPTHEGRSIYALKVSDNVAVDEDEPAILIIAQHHARELNSPHMVIGAMQRLLAAYASDPALQAVVDDNEVWFVPMVNPDGVEHCWNVDEFWRKNRRDNGNGTFGVDLNRNYPTLWSASCAGSTNSNSDTYRGPSPGSEPETVCMRNLVERLRPEIYIDFHSSGQEVLRTYPPCGSTTPAIDAFIEHYVDDLRAPMTYGKRDPSASGEAPEDHWQNGTNSYLIEIGTAFQPDFSLTVAEEARVWPGLERAMTTWRAAVRGHVMSANGGPLAATITYTPDPFAQGEQCYSRDRDGRYGLWLPLGSWTVTYEAAGHLPVSIPVTVNSYDMPVVHDVTLPVDPFTTFGQGCPGSAQAPPPPCPELNPAGGTLSNALRDNEYCYQVPNNGPLQVSSFDIWTGSTGGTVSVPAAIYPDNGGGPSGTALGTTTVSVGATPGFYTATFNPPVVVNGTFYLGLDTSAQNAYISTLTSGSGGVGYYRDLINGPTNWTGSGLVQNPSWRVTCQAVGNNPLTPTIGFDGSPQLGTTYEPKVGDALASTFAILASGGSDQFHQGLPLPLPLPNAPGCELQVAADVLFLSATDANGDASDTIVVPANPVFVGTVLYHQWLIWDPAANALGLAVSNAGSATIEN